MEAAIGTVSNLGIDLARFDRRTRVREAIARDSVRAVPVSAPKPRAHANIKLGVRLSNVLLFLFFISGVLCVVFSYAQLSAVNNANTRMTRELRAAVREQNVLTATLESRIKLDEIAEIAVNEFGFVKLDRRQVIYVDMSGPAKAEVLSNVSLKNIIWDSISGIFN
jgi:hypothetical protein